MIFRKPPPLRFEDPEPAPPSSTALSTQTRSIVGKMFAPEQHADVEQLLSEECNDNLPLTREYQRIQMAVLKLSHGDVDELMLRITDAQQDWRDTLMVAGFGHNATEHLSWANSYLHGEAEPWTPWQSADPMAAALYDASWVKCPRCGWRFDTQDLRAYTGKRHRRCGQLITLVKP